MKFLVLLVVLCGAIHLSEQALTRKQIDEMLLKLLYDCQAKEGATDDDIEHIKTRQAPQTHGEKCIFACIGEHIGLMKDGKVDMEKSIKMAEGAFGPGDPKVAAAKAILADCGSVTDPDRCEAAAKGQACSMESAKKHGYDFQKDFL